MQNKNYFKLISMKHFILMEQRFETLEKKMHLHQNPSPTCIQWL